MVLEQPRADGVAGQRRKPIGALRTGRWPARGDRALAQARRQLRGQLADQRHLLRIEVLQARRRGEERQAAAAIDRNGQVGGRGDSADEEKTQVMPGMPDRDHPFGHARMAGTQDWLTAAGCPGSSRSLMHAASAMLHAAGETAGLGGHAHRQGVAIAVFHRHRAQQHRMLAVDHEGQPGDPGEGPDGQGGGACRWRNSSSSRAGCEVHRGIHPDSSRSPPESSR